MILKTSYNMKPPVSARLRKGLYLSTGLTGLFMINEGSGPQTFDSSENSCLGTINDIAVVLWKIGINGHALSFPGDNTKFLNLTGRVVSESYSAFTIRFTFKSDGTTAGLTYGGVDLYVNAGTTILFRHEDLIADRTIKAIHDVRTGWHTVTCTWDGVKTAVYADGIYYGGVAAVGTMTIPSYRIGVGGGGQNLTGLISDLAVWNRALNASEVNFLFYKGLSCMFDRPMDPLFSIAGAPPEIQALYMDLSTQIWTIKHSTGLFSKL